MVLQKESLLWHFDQLGAPVVRGLTLICCNNKYVLQNQKSQIKCLKTKLIKIIKLSPITEGDKIQ